MESFRSESYEPDLSLPSPQSPCPSSLSPSRSAPSPSTSFGESQTPPSRKALKKQMKLLKLQQSLESTADEQPQQVEDTPVEEEIQLLSESPKDAQPQESKRKKQAMKRIVGFDPVLIAQAMEEKPVVPIKREPSGPPKPAWGSVESKPSTSLPVSLLVTNHE